MICIGSYRDAVILQHIIAAILARSYMSYMPIAYKFVSIMVMMSEVNYYSPRLHLPIDVPIRDQDIQFVLVYPPGMHQFGGRFQVNSYSFTFFNRAHFIHKLDEFGNQSEGIAARRGESVASTLERASLMKFAVNTNNLYCMATNWLIALDVDVARLEKSNTPCVNKHPFFASKRGPVASPVLTVDWLDPKSYGYITEVSVDVSAVSGEILGLADGHGFFAKRQYPVITEFAQLASIPDDEFLKYSTMERSNLLVRFAGVHCSDMHCPDVDEPLLLQSNAVSPVAPISTSPAKQK